MKPRVVFLHGLESGPEGSKVKAIRDAGYSVEAPDMRGMSLVERVRDGFEVVYNGDVSNTIIVGSSYGGAAAVEIANRLVKRGLIPLGCVLCAPALYKDEYPIDGNPPNAACRTIIIHGEMDSVVPFAWSRGWAGGQSNVSLITVDDGHRLSNSHEFILRAIDMLCALEGRGDSSGFPRPMPAREQAAYARTPVKELDIQVGKESTLRIVTGKPA